jgi:hypothetical protein
MFVALSFVGILPAYILDCVHQVRLFFDGDIVLILDDLNSPYLAILEGKYRVIPVKYQEVQSPEFIQCYHENKDKFMILPWLKGRELLFIRCFERFFLLGNAMKQRNLTDCFFMELDNLIYDDPRIWLSEFKKWNMCFMFDHYDRAASGVMYVKDSASMDGLLEYMIKFIHQWEVDPEVWLSEMAMLYGYYLSASETVQLLPTFWTEEPGTTDSGETPPFLPSVHFDKYNNTVFDAAAIGIMLYGFDTGDKNNPRDIGIKSKYSLVDYTPYLNKIVWKTDEKNRRIPYFNIGGNYIKINNLHVHCKNLAKALSFPR